MKTYLFVLAMVALVVGGCTNDKDSVNSTNMGNNAAVDGIPNNNGPSSGQGAGH